MIERLKTRLGRKYEVLSYLVFGVLTTVVNYIVYFFLTRALSVNYLIANGAAWVIAVLFAYVTNRKFVFESTSTTTSERLQELVKFVGGRVASLAADMLIMYIGIDLLGLGAQDFWVKTFSQVVVIVMNYVISKWFVFKG